MTDSKTDLLIQLVRDIPKCLHMYLQPLPPDEEDIQTPPYQPGAGVCLPLRILLFLRPSSTPLRFVEKKQTILFTPSETQKILTYADQKHLSKEETLKALIKLSLQGHQLVQEKKSQFHRKPLKHSQIEIDIELWGPMTWDEAHTDTNTA